MESQLEKHKPKITKSFLMLQRQRLQQRIQEDQGAINFITFLLSNNLYEEEGTKPEIKNVGENGQTT